MKRILFGLLLMVFASEVWAQGSAPAPAQVWKHKTADTVYVRLNSGDTVKLYDSLGFTVLRSQATNKWMFLPDSVRVKMLQAAGAVRGTVLTATSGLIIGDGTHATDTLTNDGIQSIVGSGLGISGGQVYAIVGPTIEGSEITNSTITKLDLDTTGIFAALGFYKVTTTVADSQYATMNRAKYYLGQWGIPATTPTNGYGPRYNSSTGAWEWAANGGGGTGVDILWDTTQGTGGAVWHPSTMYIRPKRGFTIGKSGAHPADTVLMGLDPDSVVYNYGNKDSIAIHNSTGTNLISFVDSSIYTKVATSNSGGLISVKPLHMRDNIVFDSTVLSSRTITQIWQLFGMTDSSALYVNDPDSLWLEGNSTNKPVVIGSGPNWRFQTNQFRAMISGGSILGNNTFIDSFARIDQDTATIDMAIKMGQRDTLLFLATGDTPDTALLISRDAANDTTRLKVITGVLSLEAAPGRMSLDSSVLRGSMNFRYNTADSLKSVAVRGSSAGLTTFDRATGGADYTITIPNAAPTGRKVLGYESGAYAWVTDSNTGTGGSGNGTADFDTTTSRNTNNLKGNSDSVITVVQRRTGNVVNIRPGPGLTMTIGDTVSGLFKVDDSLLVYTAQSFGAAWHDISRWDSTRTVNLRNVHDYFNYGDIYVKPEQADDSGVRFWWGWSDSANALYPDSSHRPYLVTMKDSVGTAIGYMPLNLAKYADQPDSLFSVVYSYMTISTDTALATIKKVYLWVNNVKVDSAVGAKSSAALTTDSANFTDRSLNRDDQVTVTFVIGTNPNAATRYVTLEKAYLNMRRR